MNNRKEKIYRNTRNSVHPITFLPDDLLWKMFSFLSPENLRKLRIINKKWKDIGREIGTECYFINKTPYNTHYNTHYNTNYEYLGLFVLYPSLINNKFAYYKVQDPGKMIWYDGDDLWLAGIESEKGQCKGKIAVKADHNNYVPWKSITYWLFLQSKKTAFDLQCSNDIKFETIARKIMYKNMEEEKMIPKYIELYSNNLKILKNLHKAFLGKYKINKKLGKINYRYSYTKANNKMISLWYDGRCWVFGLSDIIGRDQGYIVAQDDSISPNKINISWQINYNNNWMKTKSIFCRSIHNK